MLINPVRNPSIFRRRFPIRSCYPSQHLLRQNPLPRSQFGFRRRFPRAASEPRAVALRRVNARKSFGPNCSLARRMEEEYSASLRPGPQSQMARALLLKCCRGELHRGVVVLSKADRRRCCRARQGRPQAAGRWACESKDRASAGRALSGDLLVQLRHL